MLLGAALNPQLDESLTSQIEKYAKAGFDYIDLALDYPAVPEKLDADMLKECLKNAGIPLFGQTPSQLPFGSPYNTVRKAAVQTALQALAFLENLDAKSVVFHPDGDYGFAGQAFLDWNAESLTRVADAAQKTKVLLENASHGPFSKAENLVRLIKTADLEKRVFLCIDVGHAFVGQTHACDDLQQFLDTSLAQHVHLSDNNGLTDQHLPLGQGKIDWTKVKNQMQQAGVPGATIECYAGGINGVLHSKKKWQEIQ